MTCIVGLIENGQVHMGGDSAVSYYVVQTLVQRKVFRHGNFLLGYSGSVRMLQLLQFAFAPPEHPTDMGVERYLTTLFVDELRKLLKDAGNAGKEKEQESSTGYFLIGYRGRLFRVGFDYGIGEVAEGFDAIGSGCQVALGALHATQQMSLVPQKRLELALRAAADLCQGVGTPFTFEVL